jgi:hypothetical protein
MLEMSLSFFSEGKRFVKHHVKVSMCWGWPREDDIWKDRERETYTYFMTEIIEKKSI